MLTNGFLFELEPLRFRSRFDRVDAFEPVDIFEILDEKEKFEISEHVSDIYTSVSLSLGPL